MVQLTTTKNNEQNVADKVGRNHNPSNSMRLYTLVFLLSLSLIISMLNSQSNISSVRSVQVVVNSTSANDLLLQQLSSKTAVTYETDSDEIFLKTKLHNITERNVNAIVDQPVPCGRIPRRIYIDLGANCGNSYWRAKQGKVLGTMNTLKKPTPYIWESYLWECNPKLIEWFLNDLVATEPNVTLIPKAATTFNGNITFHLTSGQEQLSKELIPNPTCDPNSVYQPSGASTIYSTAKRAGQEITVPTLDFLQWHKELNLQLGDVVHMKIDIEGAELDIIENFLSNDDTNQICYWDIFWIEYHKTIFEIGTNEYNQHEIFEKNFPNRYLAKCGRPLWPNVYL
jgi:FkbM family methyltransferase